MEIVKNIIEIEDCFDGSFMKKILLNISISKTFIYYIGGDSKLEYFGDFARPFFRAIKDNYYIIKGVEGSNEIEATLHRNNLNTVEKYLIDYLNKFVL